MPGEPAHTPDPAPPEPRAGAAARESAHDHDDALADEASDESFPASDPPSSTHAHAGRPAR